MSIFVKASTVSVFVAFILAACSVDSMKKDGQSAPSELPMQTAVQPTHNPKLLSDGVWKVGLEIEVGTYTTTAPDTTPGCYWARLKGFDGEPSSLIRNGRVSQGGKGRFTINKNDVGVELTGECIWKKEE